MQLVRYQILFMIQLVMLLYDIFANAFSEYLGTSNVYMLVIYTLQDLLIITAAIALCLEFSSTFIFQAGLVGVVLSKFKGALISSAIYFLFCLGIHAWSLTVRWTNMMAVPSSTGYFLLFAAQRTWSLFYYFFYKRAIYRLGDIRFYEECEWIRKEFEKRNQG